MAEIAKQIASGKTLGVEYTVHDRTGTVEGTDSRSETEVTGTVSGGHSNLPVSGNVQSKTTNYQNVYLKDEDGDTHTIELVDFLVPCTAGHTLTFFLLKSDGRLYGEYFAAYNHDTRQHYEHYKNARSEMFPWKWLFIAIGVVGVLTFLSYVFDSQSTFGAAILLTIVAMVIAGIGLWLAGLVLGFLRSLSVKGNPAFKQYKVALGK